MTDRNWFITGTSSGLGRELVDQLLARGDRVTATVRAPDALADAKSRHGGRLTVATLDVTDTANVRRVVDEVFAAGRVDVVVSNAGYGLFGAAEEVTDEQIERQIATNLVGSIQLIRAALPHLRRQGRGRVLQVSSEGGQIAYPGFSLYHATKWGIEGFVEAVAQEVAPFGIAFTLVEPGPARTSFRESLVRPPAMEVYDETPAGEVRRAIASGAFERRGDPVRMAKAMIDSVDRDPAPRRLTLGAGAYASIREALGARIVALDAQKDVALSGDSPTPAG